MIIAGTHAGFARNGRDHQVLAAAAPRPALTDRYARLLAALLAGLAIGGKGVAYIGVPPLYVTEMVLGLGIVALIRTRCVTAVMVTLPGLLMVILMAWAAMQTIPYLGTYGVDALRDSVLVFYCLFAFIVAGLVIQKPERISDAVRFFRWFTGLYVYAAPLLLLSENASFIPMPRLWSQSSAILLRPSEAGVHLSACAAFTLLGFRPARRAWVCAFLLGLTIVATQSRGGLLAIMGPFTIALLFSRLRRQVAAIACIAGVVLSIAYAADLGLPKHKGEDDNERALTVRQAVDNVASMVVSGNEKQDDTKEWRLAWWNHIVDYTVHGRYFWTGKGFGVSLAQSDGFGTTVIDQTPLRSPHSCNLNILARTGVPGLAIWVVLLLSWSGLVAGTAYQASQRQHTVWRNLLIFIACYWAACLIDGSTDVALEGPMIGAWFWCLTGCGIAMITVYRVGSKNSSQVLSVQT